MELLNYSLTALVSFLGLYAGAALAFLVPEEMKAGRKYFVWAQRIIVLLIAALLLNSYDVNIVARAVIYLALVSVMMLKIIDNRLFYPLLAIAFFLGSASQQLFFMVASLVFLYGLPAGSLFVNVKNKKTTTTVKLLVSCGSFILIALLLFALK